MGVKASPEVIREMKKEIASTIRDLERISNGIRSGMPGTDGWEDDKAQQFNTLMGRIATLTAGPIETLNASLPKLEKLAVSLEQYSSVNFNG